MTVLKAGMEVFGRETIDLLCQDLLSLTTRNCKVSSAWDAFCIAIGALWGYAES
jgi:hypothetical protein